MNTLTKNLYAMIAMGLVSGNISAKDLYIAANGSDSNSGTEASSPRATLTGLNSIIANGDIVHVSGMIDMSAEKPADFVASAATWSEGGKWMSVSADGKYQGFNISSRDNTEWKGITFVGEDPELDGFDGKEQVPHFIIRGRNNNGTKFKNLGFINGISNINGGTLVFRDEAIVEFENCRFFNNHPDWSTYELEGNLWKAKSGASEKGGCIRSEGNCTLTFNNCLFESNINRQGGAIFLSGTAKDRTRSGEVKIYNSIFRNNTAYGCVDGDDANILDNTKGGAIAVYALNQEVYLDIDHCIFEGNCTKNEAGAIWLYDNTAYGHYCDVTITNSAFYRNESNNGGAIEISHTNSLWDDKDYACCQKVKIANTTFSQNKAATNGGAILLWGASTNPNYESYPKTELWMMNCTLVGNYTNGNSGHGAGYKEMDYGENGKVDHADRHFYNCLFEGNLALNNGSKQENSDFQTAFLGQDIRNCYIGCIRVSGISMNDFTGSLDESVVYNYSGNTADDNSLYYVANNETALNLYDNKTLNEKDIVMPFIPLSKNSPLRTAGNTSLLTLASASVENPAKEGIAHPMSGVDITKADQLGFARENSKCAIGAAEACIEDIILEYLGGTEVKATLKAEYGTLILPFDAVIPEGLKVHSVADATSNGKYNTLNMQEVSSIKANVPYIIQGTEGDEFVFTGCPAEGETSYTEGLLTGVLTETFAPKGSYVLQNQEGVLGFYLVDSENYIKVTPNHAYLTYNASAEVQAFIFDLSDVTTSVAEVAADKALVNVYSINGVLVRKAVKSNEALNGLTKGLYIVNGVKKAVK